MSWLLMHRDVDAELSSYPETFSCLSAVTEMSNRAMVRTRVLKNGKDLSCGDSKVGSP